MPEATTNSGCSAGTSGEQRWREKVWMDEAHSTNQTGKLLLLLLWLTAQHLCSRLIINQETRRKKETEQMFDGSCEASSSSRLPERTLATWLHASLASAPVIKAPTGTFKAQNMCSEMLYKDQKSDLFLFYAAVMLFLLIFFKNFSVISPPENWNHFK